MADTKISAFSDGVTANAADKIPVERSLTNVYVTPAYIKTYLGTPVLDIAQSPLAPAGSETVTTVWGAVIPRRYLIASGTKLTIGLDSRVRIL